MSRIQGIIPIIPTPFAVDGAIDEAGMRRVIDYVLRAGAHGVAFPAMASEFYALTERERVALTELIVHEVGGAVPVVGTATAQSPQAALELARAVAAAGVDAIMVMPPYVVRDGLPATTRLFAQMASAVDLPLIIQNAPPPLGSAYGPDVIKKLMDEVPQIAYVKEETAPGGQRITKLLSDPPAALQGVFGGAGGRYIMDELNRGAIGAMPACEVTELHVRIFDTYQSGDVEGARALYNRSLPLLTFQAVFRMDMTKEVLKRRGIIGSAHVRVGSVALDELDQAELSVLLAEIEDLLLAPALA
ncbi:MAG TPA: dihydrodipicolinate synthase family protein [Trueperaceae bacterium]|nr:dihydrodipicolinate synthase family protein [Trueperaceae bacterium]